MSVAEYLSNAYRIPLKRPVSNEKSNDNDQRYINEVTYSSEKTKDESKKTSFSIEAILGKKTEEDNQTKSPKTNLSEFEFRKRLPANNEMTPGNKYIPGMALPNSAMQLYLEGGYQGPVPQRVNPYNQIITQAALPYHLLPYLGRPMLANAYQAAVAAYTNSLPGQLDRFHKMADEKIFFANHKHHHHGYYQQLGEGSNRVKRVRTVFTQSQIERLEREFSKQHYMIGTERFCLARQLNLNESQVKVWFQNRRIKWRKQQPKSHHRPTNCTFVTPSSTNSPSSVDMETDDSGVARQHHN